MSRKIVFHGGPTNSGKTYHALERFLGAKSGIYCGPLKLLAVEVRAFCVLGLVAK
jgi:ATP-dependent RNA helicase SUPV3L1/SUV3